MTIFLIPCVFFSSPVPLLGTLQFNLDQTRGLGTRRQGDEGDKVTRGQVDKRTRGQGGDKGDKVTRGQGDKWTRGQGDKVHVPLAFSFCKNLVPLTFFDIPICDYILNLLRTLFGTLPFNLDQTRGLGIQGDTVTKETR